MKTKNLKKRVETSLRLRSRDVIHWNFNSEDSCGWLYETIIINCILRTLKWCGGCDQCLNFNSTICISNISNFELAENYYLT